MPLSGGKTLYVPIGPLKLLFGQKALVNTFNWLNIYRTHKHIEWLSTWVQFLALLFHKNNL